MTNRETMEASAGLVQMLTDRRAEHQRIRDALHTIHASKRALGESEHHLNQIAEGAALEQERMDDCDRKIAAISVPFI